MIKSQRILIAIVLPLLALILHTTLCEWGFKVSITTSRHLLVYQHEQLQQQPRLRRGLKVYTGLYSQWSNREIAAIAGIVVPLMLLATEGFLLLGWRYQRTIAQGLCPHCRYDLSGADHEACPECGKIIRKDNPA